MGAKRAPAHERFWRFVEKSDCCWEWTGCLSGPGYGQMRVSGKTVNAHRVSWEMHNRQVIPAGLYVCHHCDNRKCVRPEHLFLGTARDNAMDMFNKGRHAPVEPMRGEAAVHAKLTANKVRAIRAIYRQGLVGVPTLGRLYGVSGTAIHNIVTGKVWREVA